MQTNTRKLISRAGVRAAVLGTLTTMLLAGTSTAVSGPAHAMEARDDARESGYAIVKVRERYVEREKFAAPVVEKEDSSMNAGETKVVRLGDPGVRNVTYWLVFENGKLTHKRVKSQEVQKKPRPKVVRIGTKIPTGVWDRLAQCESGGNWHINTGNGYYGGLQFSAATWRSVGGPGLPHQHSRETQIKYAKILQARSGWGQWGCAHARFN